MCLHVFSRFIVSLALVLAPLPALAAPAPDTNAEARTAYSAGETSYRLGRFEKAAGEFERAYELSGLPDILYNIGLAHLRWYDVDVDLAHLRRAKVVLQNYVIEIQKNPDLGNLEEAESLIAQIDDKIAAHQSGAKPVPPIEPDPDDDDPDVVEPPQTEVGPDPGKSLRLGGAIGIGIGAAFVVGGVVSGVAFGLKGQAAEANLATEFQKSTDANCVADDPREECMTIEDNIVSFRDQGRAANGLSLGLGLSLGGVGLVGVVVGAVLLVKGKKKTSAWEQRSLSLAPTWSRDGVGVGFSGRF